MFAAVYYCTVAIFLLKPHKNTRITREDRNSKQLVQLSDILLTKDMNILDDITIQKNEHSTTLRRIFRFSLTPFM